MSADNVLSLGGGVQSSTLAKMSEDGVIAIYDWSVFADTTHEPQHTTTLDPKTGELIFGGIYGWLKWLAARVSFPIHHTSAGDLMAEALKIRTSGKTGKRYIKGLIPAYLADENGRKSGLLGRKCTVDFKVRAIQKFCRERLGQRYSAWRKLHAPALKVWKKYSEDLKLWREMVKAARRMRINAHPQKPPFPRAEWDEMQNDALINMTIGISLDEVDRMKPSREPWIRNSFPLIELGMTREDCKTWMSSRGYPVPPRSACKQCPFHSDEEWANLKENSPIDFADAVTLDYALRAAAKNQEALTDTPFLHASLVPLDKVDFKAVATPGHAQLNLFRNECEGLCGV